MNLSWILRLALSALLRNRARSLLTMLGVIIGVAAVIVTIAIGVGARSSVEQQISSLGSNLLIVLPGSVTQSGARSGFGGASTLTPEDGMAIGKLPGVAAVSPSVTVRAQAVAGSYNWQTTVTGVAPTYTFVRSWSLGSGTLFSQSDVASAGKVAVLGQTVIENLFPDGSSPLGKNLLIKGVPFTVVGTLAARGQSGIGQDQDDTILIPLYVGHAAPHWTDHGQHPYGLIGGPTANRAGSNRNDCLTRAAPPHRAAHGRRFFR